MAGKRRPLSPEELKARFRVQLVQAITTITMGLIKYGALVAIAYCVYLTADALAGKKTAADIGLNFLANVEVSKGVAWLFGVGGVGYGLAQRKVRRDTIERLQERIRQYEKNVDPGRTSSRLTERGDTREEDQ